MSAVSSDRKSHVDHGVQIRFIKDLHDTGGAYPDKSRGNTNATPPSNKYGVAVRVQGISGQPYVVLKDGEKGDSYGVQLNTPAPTSGPPSPSNSLLRGGREPAEVVNPYGPSANVARSPVSAAEDEDGEIFGSPLRRPPGDGQAGTQGVESEEVRDDLQDRAAGGGEEEEEYNEAGLKPVKVNGVGMGGGKQNPPGLVGSLGRRAEKTQVKKPPTKPEPPKTANQEPPLPAVDTDSLAPINKLISKFNNATPRAPQARGRPGARQQLGLEERKRSRSLDARKDPQPEMSPPTSSQGSSPTPNPYAAPLATPPRSMTSSVSASSSLGRTPVSKWAPPEAPKPGPQVNGRFVREAVPKKPEIRPRTQNAGVVNGEEVQLKKNAFSVQKENIGDQDASLKRKTNPIREKTTGLKGGSGAEIKQVNVEERQEQLSRCRRDLQEAHDELAMERMSREVAESRLRLQEDQLAELQEELRRVSEISSHPDSTQMDVMALRADLAEAVMLRQRQEEILHQRERELTALKGALKEEVECHDREMEDLREQYGQDMESLRRTVEQVTQSQDRIEEERERVNSSIFTLEEELESCRDEGEQWRMQLENTKQELHKTTQELLRCRLEKEDFQNKLEDHRELLLAAKKQFPVSDSSAEELRRCRDDLQRARADVDERKRELDMKKEAFRALKEAGEEKEGELLAEIGRLKEQFRKEKAELEKVGSSGTTVVDHGAAMELQEANARLRERIARMTKLHSSSALTSDAEEEVEALENENRSLKSQLEEAKRGATRLSKERDELTRRLEERDQEREALRRGKSDLEEQKRLLDRALEKITKEMEVMMGDSRQSVANLQAQLDDYRERSRKELLEAQRSNKDRQAELQRAQSHLKVQQDEVSRLKKDLLLCSEERDSAQLERDLINNRFRHLESEMETEKSTHTDRTREIRGLEDKIKTMEIELDEERSSVELLNDRVTRTRDQVDQLRSELMQERSTRHDLEMDKSALERQLKELRSRLADMEGPTRPSPTLTLLENRIQELEERLRSEEREKSSIQASQRRMERKLKEVNATLDQERNQHIEQRDQLSLRVKALKRQVDESEGEVERLEGVRRKVLRDLEEQQELQEALHAKVSALENEVKRKSQQTHHHRAALGSSALSSDDEDGFYDNSITSILNDGHLSTTSC
ncbi:cingulin isoform X2 [Antennarius striatus]|uniref:cingulin isoform X2 n=1 Tax=Antennarius striatus TaxID=241820 RepID=UPI0035B3186D